MGIIGKHPGIFIMKIPESHMMRFTVAKVSFRDYFYDGTIAVSGWV